jgi:anti-sigma factor RsiW
MAADSNAELMTAYLDDALEGGDAESFERWLAESPEARQEVESLRKMLSVVRELPEVEAPPDFYDKVSKKLRRRRVGPDGAAMGLVSLPFQVLSILVIMVIAATYLMLEIERDSATIEKDPSAAEAADAP